MTFGLTTTGFLKKSYAQLKDELDQAFRANPRLGSALNLLPTALYGQIEAIIGDRYADIWEHLEADYQITDPNQGGGAALDNLLELAGTERLAATFSAVGVTLTGTPLAVIPNTVVFAVTGATESLFNLDNPVTLGGGGGGTGTATAAQNGPVQALTGTLTTISVGDPDLATVTNAADATLGRNTEKDSAGRIRLFGILNATEAAGIDEIYLSIINSAGTSLITGIDEARVFENITDATVGGRPGHSFEAVVHPAPTTATDIGAAIWGSKPGGAESHGSSSTTGTDSEGKAHTIEYTVATEIDIWIVVIVTTDGTFPADGLTQIQAQILTDMQLQDGIGDDVVYGDIQAAVYKIPGVLTDATTVGVAPAPVGVINITIAEEEIAQYATARISVT